MSPVRFVGALHCLRYFGLGSNIELHLCKESTNVFYSRHVRPASCRMSRNAERSRVKSWWQHVCRPTDVRLPQDVTVKGRRFCDRLPCKVGLTVHVVVTSAWNVLSGCSTGDDVSRLQAATSVPTVIELGPGAVTSNGAVLNLCVSVALLK